MRRLDAKRAVAAAVVLAALIAAIGAAIRIGCGPSADRRVVLSGGSGSAESPGLEPIAVGVDKASGSYKVLLRDSGGHVYEVELGAQGRAGQPAESP